MEFPTQLIKITSTEYQIQLTTVEMAELGIRIDKTTVDLTLLIQQVQLYQASLVDLRSQLILSYIKTNGTLPPTK